MASDGVRVGTASWTDPEFIKAGWYPSEVKGDAEGRLRYYAERFPALAWENKPKRLTAPPEAVVRITKYDGSWITGRGFTGDFRSRQVSFSGPVEGSYVWTGDENDED